MCCHTHTSTLLREAPVVTGGEKERVHERGWEYASIFGAFSYDLALMEVARRLGVLAHKGGQLRIVEWGSLAVLLTILVVARNPLTKGKG